MPRTSLFAIAFVSVTCLQAQDPLAYYNWFINEFWRFVFAHQEVGKYAQTFLEYPPMRESASFNMYAERRRLNALAKTGDDVREFHFRHSRIT